MAQASRLVFEWDAEKSERCRRERGFGFDYITPAFEIPTAGSKPIFGRTTGKLASGCLAASRRAYMRSCMRYAAGTCGLFPCEKQIYGNSGAMGRLVRARLEADGTVSVRQGSRWERVVSTADVSRIDATTEEDIARQQAEDDAEAARNSAAWARRVRRRTGLSQAEFGPRIGVSTLTVRQWEREGVSPGPTGTLLRRIERAPEAARAVPAAK